MPTRTDPLTGSRIMWDARRTSVVTVVGEVGPPLPLRERVPLAVKFRRRDLTTLLHTGEDRARLRRDDQERVRESGEDPPPLSLIDEQALSGIFFNVATTIAHDLTNRAIWYDSETRDIFHRPMRRFQRVDRDRVSWAPMPQTMRPACGELPLVCVVYPGWLFDKKHRPLLESWIVESGPGGHVALTSAVFRAMFPVRLLRHLLTPPRGKTARAWPLLERVPVALFMAREIIGHARGDRRLDARIAHALKEEKEHVEYVDSHARGSRAPRPVKATAVALVDRAFWRDATEDAWTKYRVKRPVDFETPQEVFSHYLHRLERHRILYIWKGLTSDDQRREIKRWTSRLLGPPGQAARDFSLLR